MPCKREAIPENVIVSERQDHTIQPTQTSIEQVALSTESEQVVVHLGLGNILIDLNGNREALKLGAVLSYLEAALVGL